MQPGITRAALWRAIEAYMDCILHPGIKMSYALLDARKREIDICISAHEGAIAKEIMTEHGLNPDLNGPGEAQ